MRCALGDDKEAAVEVGDGDARTAARYCDSDGQGPRNGKEESLRPCAVVGQ